MDEAKLLAERETPPSSLYANDSGEQVQGHQEVVEGSETTANGGVRRLETLTQTRDALPTMLLWKEEDALQIVYMMMMIINIPEEYYSF